MKIVPALLMASLAVSNAFSQSAIPFLTKDKQYMFVDSVLNVINPEKYAIDEIEQVVGFYRIKKDGRDGLVNNNGAEVTGFRYDYIKKPFPAPENRFILLKNKKYGANAFNGKDSLPFEYDGLGYNFNHVIEYSKDGKFYVVYKGKTFEASTSYTEFGSRAMGPEHEIFIVKNGTGYYGVLNENFDSLLDFKFKLIDTYGKLILGGTSKYSKEGYLYDLSGKKLLEEKVYEIQYISDDYIFVKLKKNPADVQQQNRKKEKVAFESVESGAERENNLFYWKCINANGIENSRIKAPDFISFNDRSTYMVCGGTKFLLKDQLIEFPAKFDMAYPLSGGKHIVKQNDLYGVMDKRWKTLIPIEYKSAVAGGNGNYLMFKDRSWYVFNSKDKVVDSISIGSDYAMMQMIVAKKYFINDRSVYNLDNHKTVTEDFYWDFRETGECFIGKRDGAYGAVDQNGKVVVPFEFEKVEYTYNENTPAAVWFKKGNGWQLFNLATKTLYKNILSGNPSYKMIGNYFVFISSEKKEYMVSQAGKAFMEQ